MALSTEIASSYLAVYATFPGIKKDIETALDQPAVADAAGKKAGSKFSTGLAATLGAGAIAAGAVAATGIGVALSKGFDRLVGIDTARAKLTGLGHDAESVNKIMDSALASVKGTAFGLGDAAGVAASAVAAGIAPGEELTRSLKLVGDAAAIAGVDMSSMGAIFNKVASSNKMQMDVANQLMDAGIPIMQLVAEQMGVTAEEAVKMASDGEVSFETFLAAVESGMGGAAGVLGQNSFTGALDNVWAAVGRVGAAFLDAGGKGGGLFSQLKPLMADFTGMLDGITPIAEQVGASVGKFFGDTITELRGGITAFGAAWTAFDGDITSSGFPGFMEWLAFVSRTVWAEMSGGIKAFNAAWVANDGDITSSGFPGFMEAAAFTIRQLVDYVKMLDFSSWDGFVASLGTGQPALASIGSSFQTLAPAVGQFVMALPDMAGALGTLASSILPLVAGALGFLADNIDTIIAWMPALVAGFVAWRVASMAFTAAQVAQAPVLLASNSLGLTRALIDMQVARSTAAATTAQVANTAATNGGVLANLRATASLIAQKTAMIATSVATKAAAAAQWVMNAAMSANPIMLVVLAIGALVAGLVWFFTQTELGAAIWTNFTTAIGAAWTWLWETVLQPVFAAIGAVFTWLYENVITPIVAGIVLYVQAWAAIFNWLWANILSPTFAAIGAIFGWIYNNVIVPIVAGVILYVQMWGAIFTWLWVNIVTPVFAGIQAAILAVYTWFTGTLVPGFQAVIALFGAAFEWVRANVIMPVWVGIQTVIQGVYDWFMTTLVPAFQRAINVIGDAFTNVKSIIAQAWEGIKTAAMAPVKFVVESVYRDGIKKLFDGMAEKVGLDIRMPDAPTLAFANGGVLPGYTPGRDVHQFYSPTGGRLALSGGEGIIRPDALRALGGKGWLDAVNSSRGSADGVHFANGGVWDDLGKGVGDVVGWIGGAVENVAKIFTDPGGAVNALIREPVKALLENIGGGSFGEIVAEVPLKAIDGIVEWAKNTITPPASSGSVGNYSGGITLQRLLPYIAASGTVVTDTYRDPAYNASVGGSPTSFHMDAANPAVDVAGSEAAMWSFYRMVMGDAGGWRQVLWQVAGHYDHVHVANQGGVFGDLPVKKYDSGGYLEPGHTMVYNGTGKPEPVFTNAQWADMEKNGGVRDLVLEIDGDPAMVELVKLMDIRIKGSEDDRRVLVRAGG